VSHAPAVRERVDPKVIAALVNRFIADASMFLQAFAGHAEARLLELGRRVRRLEQLVRLLEAKVEGLDVEGEGRATTGHALPSVEASASLAPTSSCIASAPSVAVAEADRSGGAGAPADERYNVFSKMHACGVPRLAIQQKFLLAQADDPSLDQAVLDALVGVAKGAVGAPPQRREDPVARQPAGPSLPSAPNAIASEGPVAQEQEPHAAAQVPMAPPMTMAEAAAQIARRRQNAAAAKSGTPEAPKPAPAPPNVAPAAPIGGASSEVGSNPAPKATLFRADVLAPAVLAGAAVPLSPSGGIPHQADLASAARSAPPAPKAPAPPKAEPTRASLFGASTSASPEPVPAASPQADPLRPSPFGARTAAAPAADTAARMDGVAPPPDPAAVLKLIRSAVADDDDRQSDVSDF